MASYIDPTKDRFRAFEALERPGVVHMLNLLKFREVAVYEDGTHATGREAYEAYGRETAPIFQALGGRIVWSGWPELMLIGPDQKAWDLAFIAEYPSVAAFSAMLRMPEYRKAVRHRTAGVEDSRLIRMQPGKPGAGFGDMDAYA